MNRKLGGGEGYFIPENHAGVISVLLSHLRHGHKRGQLLVDILDYHRDKMHQVDQHTKVSTHAVPGGNAAYGTQEKT